jgi:hypothetical protein
MFPRCHSFRSRSQAHWTKEPNRCEAYFDHKHCRWHATRTMGASGWCFSKNQIKHHVLVGKLRRLYIHWSSGSGDYRCARSHGTLSLCHGTAHATCAIMRPHVPLQLFSRTYSFYLLLVLGLVKVVKNENILYHGSNKVVLYIIWLTKKECEVIVNTILIKQIL